MFDTNTITVVILLMPKAMQKHHVPELAAYMRPVYIVNVYVLCNLSMLLAAKGPCVASAFHPAVPLARDAHRSVMQWL